MDEEGIQKRIKPKHFGGGFPYLIAPRAKKAVKSLDDRITRLAAKAGRNDAK